MTSGTPGSARSATSGRGRGSKVHRRVRDNAAGGAPPVGRTGRSPATEFTWRDRLRYRVDTVFSRGTAPLILWLAILTFAIVLVAAVALALLDVAVNDDDRSFVEAMWASLLRAIDPGTMGSDAGWSFRIVSLAVTIGGIFIVSTLIGLIATGLDRRLERLREGRGRVVETGHTVLLGWSPTVPGIVAELVVANANQRDGCVVVLAQREQAAMEHDIRARVPDLGTTRLVCRTGDPSDPVDVRIANPLDAKAVVLLAQDTGGDGAVIRSVLALMTQDPDLARAPVVAEVRSAKTARALEQVTHGRVIAVVSDEIIGRVAVQVCRHRGLSAVYQDLLDFDGDEVYFAPAGGLAGRPFADAILATAESTVIGLRRGGGEILVAPPMGTVIAPDDQLVVIAEDDDTVHIDGDASTVATVVPGSNGLDLREREHILVFGWSGLGPVVVRELDHYLGAGSTVHVVVDPAHAATPEIADLTNLQVRVSSADHHDPDRVREILEAEQPDHVMLLCYRDVLAPAEADAAALMALLQVRHCLDRWPADRLRPSVVAELLDPRDVELARVTGADDFVVSERLTSLLLAQLAENPALDPVFAELLDAGGAEITLRPVEQLGDPATFVTFADLVRAGIAHGEVVIGYCERAAGATDGVVLNAAKSRPLSLAAADEAIVVTRGREPTGALSAAGSTGRDAQVGPAVV